MYKISKKLALFCALLLIYPLVFAAKPGFAAQNNGGRVTEYVKDADEKLNAAKSEYAKDADKKINSAETDEKEENRPKELRLIIELDKDSLVEEAINKDIDYDKLDIAFIDEKKQELKEDQDKLLTEIKNEAIKADVEEVRHYDTIFNGVALSADAAEIEKIEALPGVKSVYVSQEFQRPFLKSSNSIIGSGYA